MNGFGILAQTEIVSTAVSEQGITAVERYVGIANESPSNFPIMISLMMFLFVILPLTWGMIAFMLKRGFKTQQTYLSSTLDPAGLQMTILNEMLSLIRRSEAKFDAVLYGINRSVSFEQLLLLFEEKLQRNKLEMFVMVKNVKDNDNVVKDEDKIKTRIRDHITRLQSDAIYFIDKFTCDEINIKPSQVLRNDLNDDRLFKMACDYVFTQKERDTYVFDTISCINDDILKSLEQYKRKQD